MPELFKDQDEEIDELLNKKEIEKKSKPDLVGKSEQLERTYDNFVFRKKYRENPLTSKKKYKVYGYETVSLSSFLEMRMWPRSIYVTDKLLRLVAGSKYEFLKRYMAKKRSIPLNMIWIIMLIFGVIIVIVVVLFLLPKLGVI